MGTRSTIKFYSEFDNETPIVNIYQQFDGYYTGVGMELAEWLATKIVINGYNSNQTIGKGFANGMGCLAAQFIAMYKTDIGRLYIDSTYHNQEYDYHVKLIEGKLQIEVDNFKGTPQEFIDKYSETES